MSSHSIPQNRRYVASHVITSIQEIILLCQIFGDSGALEDNTEGCEAVLRNGGRRGALLAILEAQMYTPANRTRNPQQGQKLPIKELT